MILVNTHQNKGTWIILKNVLQQRKCEVLAHTREMSPIRPCDAQFQDTIYMAIHHSPCSTLIILFTLLLAFTIYIRDCPISVLKAYIIL